MQKIFNLPRGAGKTTKCMQISSDTGAAVLCHNNTGVTAVKYRAKEFHKTIPEPITVNELLTGKKMPETLVIDEALIVLERLIAGIYDLNNKQPPRIIAETLSDEKNKDRVALFPRDGTDMYTVVDLKDRWVL